MDLSNIDWHLMAAWTQAIANTVVLLLIYWQMGQMQQQMSQSDEQVRFNRSWEFLRLYRDELREEEIKLDPHRTEKDPSSLDCDSEVFKGYIEHFYKPRCHLFILLNQLVQHQQVDERILFGYLEDEFSRFVELGVTAYGRDEFKRTIGSRIGLILTHWGSHIKASRLLYGPAPA